MLINEITSRCDPAAVMQLLNNPATWAEWQPEILHAAGSSPMRVGDVARGTARMLGFEVHGQSTALDVGPRHFAEDAIVGIHMQIRYDVTTSGGETTVRHTLHLERARGPAGRLLTLLLRRRLKRMQSQALQSLVASARGGRA